ncbi:MAG: glycosyltransferase [Candidatus Aminicenantes bacterium]|nr:MAG: glycosyltransferase [Candidatus Aminicenantes bacterium]
MEFLQIGICFFLVLFLINLLQNVKRIKKQEGVKLKEPLPLISILIPARNEEKNIENCVATLLQSEYPHLEIIVLDDNSRDRTFEIVEELSHKHKRLKIIKGKELPPGWNGKNWACHQLSQVAQGEWFLFTDADTTHKPQSVSLAFAVAQKRKSVFVTYVPGLAAKTWSEKLFYPIIHLTFFALLPSRLVNYSGNSHLAFGIGPFLFIKGDFYFSFGGHESIKVAIVDDFALARKVKEHRGKISAVDGTKVMNVRFYTCFRELWYGFSKNVYEAIGSAPHYLFALLLACYFLFIFPYLSLWEAWESHQSLTVPLIQVATISLLKIILSIRFQTSFIYGLLHPFGVALALLILLNSFRISVFKKKIEWKERLYPIE